MLARCMADPSIPVVVQVTNQYIPQYQCQPVYFPVLSTFLIDHLDPQGPCLIFLPPLETETANEEKYEGTAAATRLAFMKLYSISLPGV